MQKSFLKEGNGLDNSEPAREFKKKKIQVARSHLGDFDSVDLG